MRKYTLTLAVLSTFLLGWAAQAHAQLTELTETTWGGTTGVRDWHTGSNWIGGVAPNDVAPAESLKIANLAGNWGSALTLDLGNTDARIARLKLGSTSSAVASTIGTGVGSGRLIFRNDDPAIVTSTTDADFNNDTRVNGRDFLIWQRGFAATGVNLNGQGDANGDQVVNGADLAIWQDQFGLGAGLFSPGMPGIESTGVAGATNVISAGLHIENERLGIGGTRNLTINGPITYVGDPASANLSNSGIHALSGMTVNINSDLNIVNTDGVDSIDFQINNNDLAQGTLVFNGALTGGGSIVLGSTQNTEFGLGTIRLNNASTYGGSVRAGRGNLVLGNDSALGTGTYRQQGPVSFLGYNMISTDDNRNIANNIVFAQWQSFTGEHSIELSGDLTQTNNRGLVNLLPAGKTVTISGNLSIWETDEVLERRFTVDGTGKTVITGVIRDEPTGSAGRDRRISKTGTGVLLIDVPAGNNNHSGPDVVLMGNMHYANNGSLNASLDTKAKILSIGGAVGVDTHPGGQNLATNSVFLGKFDPASKGGLMLASSDSAVNLNFSSAALTNVRNMSLAAPETGITYTGTLTPFNDQYRLGGGTGTLTLPNAQLTTASRSLSVRNGGTVRLLGSNSYGGPTVIESKYSSTGQDSSGNIVLDRLVAPVLEVNTLANGGLNSSIGASSNAASNLHIHASTLRYVGTGSTTDRLFTIGTGGATLDASGTGALVFSNTGAAVSADAADITGDLDDFGGNPNVIYNVSNSRDVIIGMPVSDPDPGDPNNDLTVDCGPNGTNCIPAFDNQVPPRPVVVTGVSDNGNEIGISAEYGFTYKLGTRIVFGAVARTLKLTGTNTQANVLTPVISNSAKGSVVGITKQGTGTWYLESVNTNTGPTLVEAGTLGGNGGVGGSLTVNSGASFTPGASGASAIGDFSVAGSFTLDSGAILGVQLGGTAANAYDKLNVTGSATLSGAINLSAVAFAPALGNAFTVLTAAGGIVDKGLTITGLTGFTKSIVGNNLILTKTAALSALASVPEPSSLVLIGMAVACCGLRRK